MNSKHMINNPLKTSVNANHKDVKWYLYNCNDYCKVPSIITMVIIPAQIVGCELRTWVLIRWGLWSPLDCCSKFVMRSCSRRPWGAAVTTQTT